VLHTEAVRTVRLVLTDTVSEASSELTQGNTDHFKLLRGCVNRLWPHSDGGIWLRGAEVTGRLRLASRRLAPANHWYQLRLALGYFLWPAADRNGYENALKLGD
jgi:hypothetical protein